MWKTVIGLEIHAQLKTDSKIFSTSANRFGDEPNINVNVVDLGFPGALPVLNKKVLELAIRFGLSVGSKINQKTLFSRKNYFYPDLPKGYQITQNELPIVEGGNIEITANDGSLKNIRLNRAHLEEDAGKNSHDIFSTFSAVDLNRAGVPLLEIVSEPDMNSKEEALEYIKKIHQLVKFLDVCNGNMFEGSFRVDVNVSVRNDEKGIIGNRVEIKNLNSFKFIERAIDFEVERQIEVLEGGKTVPMETRLYNSDTGITSSMRKKEVANDYRYFPDPDFLIFDVEDSLLEQVKSTLPEHPEARFERYIKSGVASADANVIMNSLGIANFFDEVVNLSKEPVLSSKWVVGEIMALINKSGADINSIDKFPLSSRQLADIIIKIKENIISSKMAKDLFAVVCERPDSQVEDLIKELGFAQVSDEGELVAIVEEIIKNNPEQAQQYIESNEDKRKRLIGFFVGQVMQKTKGKANPGKINEILSRLLGG